MCSRFSFTTAKDDLEAELNISIDNALRQSYNVAPAHHAYIITNNSKERLQYITWGLIPYWSRDGRNTGKLINARCEGISSQTSFRIPIRKQRCLVLADSFYIWKREGINQLPYRVKLKSSKLMLMAGIWDVWYKGEYALKSFSIVTTPANRDLREFTDRMPLILSEKELQQKWLDQLNLDEVLSMLQPYENDQLEIYRVSEKLNSTNHDSNELHQLFS